MNVLTEIIQVAIFKFFEQTQHSIPLLYYDYSVGLIRVAIKPGTKAISRDLCCVEQHPAGTELLIKYRAEVLPKLARCF